MTARRLSITTACLTIVYGITFAATWFSTANAGLNLFGTPASYYNIQRLGIDVAFLFFGVLLIMLIMSVLTYRHRLLPALCLAILAFVILVCSSFVGITVQSGAAPVRLYGSYGVFIATACAGLSALFIGVGRRSAASS